METILLTLILGIGATAVMDLLGLTRKLLFGINLPNYGLVGRWVAYMARGRFWHESISKSTAVRGEQFLGWACHYLTGMAFAALLVGIFGIDWIRQPTIGPALIVSLGALAAPLLLMQPAMGAGIASSKAVNPAAARRQSLLNHLFFGLGLYLAGQAIRLAFAN
jgi:hypothetical protein